VRRALRPLPGAKADWEILLALANHLGQKWTYRNPQEIFAEIAANNPDYRNLTWEDLGAQGVRIDTLSAKETAHA
jgi:NADH-quinone oxidoreductase subunit G